jgi:hypothetical protein
VSVHEAVYFTDFIGCFWFFPAALLRVKLQRRLQIWVLNKCGKINFLSNDSSFPVATKSTKAGKELIPRGSAAR